MLPRQLFAGDAFRKHLRATQNPIPARPNVAAMAKPYVQANSVVLGMPGQTRPAALDGGRYGFYTVLDYIPIDHRTLAANLVGYICRAYREDNAKYDPEKHAHSSPFLPRAIPQDSERSPRLRMVPPETHMHSSYCFRFRSSPARHFRARIQGKKHFTGYEREQSWAAWQGTVGHLPRSLDSRI